MGYKKGSLSQEQIQKLRDSHTGKLGAKASNWKGGRKKSGDGYVLVYQPTHPKNSKGYVYEHRLIMEAHLGRTLLSSEIVHHINGVPDDNRIENLTIFSRAAHMIKHGIGISTRFKRGAK